MSTLVLKFALLSIPWLVAFGLVEAGLRLQQRFRPVIDLDTATYVKNFSDRVHHSRFGKGEAYTESTLHPANCTSAPLRILFLGDSWVEEGNIGRASSELVAQSTHRCVEAINAGVKSYSPTPITIVGAMLIPRFRPDLIVVNIDETDLMDETIRYRRGTTFDSSGLPVAVTVSGPERLWLSGLRELDRIPLFTARAVAKLYHTQFYVPRAYRLAYPEYRNHDYANLLAPQLSAHPAQEFAAEISYFEQSLDRMITRFEQLGIRPGQLLLTHHPHFLGMPQQGRYRPVVSESLARVADRRLVTLFDAAHPDVIHKLWPDHYERAFLWPQDQFSHLTAEGYRRFGRAIGPHLTRLAQAAPFKAPPPSSTGPVETSRLDRHPARP